MVPFTKINATKLPITELPLSILHVITFSSDLNNINVRLELACVFLKAYKKYNYYKNALIQLITLLLHNLLLDDETRSYYTTIINKLIFHNNLHKQFKEFSDICKNIKIAT